MSIETVDEIQPGPWRLRLSAGIMVQVWLILNALRRPSPAVFAFIAAALVTTALPETHQLQTDIPVILFSGAALFAVYLILIRKIYRMPRETSSASTK